MPPLETRPGTYYSTPADSDYQNLMHRAMAAEYDVIKVDDAAGLETFFFVPANDSDISEVVALAMMEGIVSFQGSAIGNLIISNGRKISNGGN